MKKIVFGITSLTLGGAERVLVDITNRLSDKYDITIFTIYHHGEFEKDVSSKITLKSLYQKEYQKLNKLQKIFIPLNLLLFKKAIYKKNIKKDYDVEISFLEGPITRLFSVKNKNTRKIAWIHNDISLVFGKGLKAKLKRFLDRRLYNKYQDLIFVSKDNLERFNKVYDATAYKRVIYNYIDCEKVIEKSKETMDMVYQEGRTNFLTVARLVEQKAIDRLINVHARLIKEGLTHNVYIIGDGPLKDKLEKQVTEAKVSDTCIFLGKRSNPYPYIKNADYFCLLSYFEGYGMVLEEAKILDKFILITDTAAREAVSGYEKVKIFDNTEEGIYQGIRKILTEKPNYKEQTKIRYNNEKILEQIIELIGE
jgi:glycosyltransferase involved in cell wall biosynthesis